MAQHTVIGKLETSEFEDIILDGAVQYIAGPLSLFGIEIDNSQNTVASFVKLWDATSGVTLGTTDPVTVLKVDAGDTLFVPFIFDDGTPANTPVGMVFATGLAAACVTTGGTGGTTSPASDVTVTFKTT